MIRNQEISNFVFLHSNRKKFNQQINIPERFKKNV